VVVEGADVEVDGSGRPAVAVVSGEDEVVQAAANSKTGSRLHRVTARW
jgi:hypothetical protein